MEVFQSILFYRTASNISRSGTNLRDWFCMVSDQAQNSALTVAVMFLLIFIFLITAGRKFILNIKSRHSARAKISAY